MAWHFIGQGSGRPLVLLHGFGMTSNCWKRVLPLLARERRVLAFDIAGFGRTPPLPDGAPHTPEALVEGLRQSLQELGIETPVDVAGNSMGGFLMLAAAKTGLVRKGVGISPGGLWTQGHWPMPHIQAPFLLSRKFVRTFPRLTRFALGFAPARGLILAVPVSVKSWRMPAEDAIACAEDFAHSPAFEEIFNSDAHFTGGETITVPITIAFGTRDWLLGDKARLRHELPAHTHWLAPAGWGHVPMWDDPEGVTRLILDSTS